MKVILADRYAKWGVTNGFNVLPALQIMLGKGEITLEYFKHTLQEKLPKPLPYIATASGLILNEVKFE